jgi:2,3-bisphosphoglycerate-dependent phosphoglycerate mutase
MTKKLILLRHGESEWNALNLFTGWVDVRLSEKGIGEAKRGGQLLKERGLLPDVVHTSLLRRAIHTSQLALDEADRHWIPVNRSWRLNERHYGALQGLNKSETALQEGDDQVMIWRRSYDIPPQPLAQDDARASFHDPRYAALDPQQIPLTECLKDTVARVMPIWNDEIAPAILAGKRILISAHGNSLRALIKYLDQISDQDIVSLNIPNGQPLVYELDAQLKPIRHYYLGDPAAISAAQQAVASQGKAK